MKNILVFPCGSEIGLEIHRSMKYSRHFHLIGGSSVADHGQYIFKDYINNIPFHNELGFIETLAKIVIKHKIDAIYPAMDGVAVTIKQNEVKLGCRVIGSSLTATRICASKEATYTKVCKFVPVPKWSTSIEDISTYPVFIKPDEGYGSRNVFLSRDKETSQKFITSTGYTGKFIFCEYLPGAEYTIDCFSNRHGLLMFAGARERARISNGISTNTKITKKHNNLFQNYAKKINSKLQLRGAWFFQMKIDTAGKPKLLEIAARLGGSSGLFRNKGINFAMLSTFDNFDIDISIIENKYNLILDRALSNKYNISIEYHTAYIDYDDCLLLGSKINTELISFIFALINTGKRVILITRHDGDIYKSLANYRLTNVFDEIVHITNKQESKASYISPEGAIFIDDSHAERSDVLEKHNIPVFSPDMIETLI